LGQLAITDPFNSHDAQTCNYGYDDLARLASVDCGASIWQQNFTYDAFGNITKSVPFGGTGVSFLPGYSATNNHYTDGATYDANGNLCFSSLTRKSSICCALVVTLRRSESLALLTFAITPMSG